jgi:hypothetical protein
MALHDNPPHRVAHYTSASGTDTGGGVTITYTLAQSAIPCSINTASSSEQERFAQQGMTVTHTVAFRSSVFTTVPVRGDKIITADRTESYHVRGISYGRAYGNVPAFVYLYCEQQL